MEELTPQEIAALLRRPHGEHAEKIMGFMNKGNNRLYAGLLNSIEISDDFKVLEIGPGNAMYAREILSRALNVDYTGLDFSQDSIRLAKNFNQDIMNKHKIQFVLGEVSGMPFKENTFDIVIGINIIYFLENPLMELGQILKSLRTKGVLALGYRPRHVMDRLPFTNFGFLKYNSDELEALLIQAGFSSVISESHTEPDREVNGQTVHSGFVISKAYK